MLPTSRPPKPGSKVISSYVTPPTGHNCVYPGPNPLLDQASAGPWLLVLRAVLPTGGSFFSFLGLPFLGDVWGGSLAVSAGAGSEAGSALEAGSEDAAALAACPLAAALPSSLGFLSNGRGSKAAGSLAVADEPSTGGTTLSSLRFSPTALSLGSAVVMGGASGISAGAGAGAGTGSDSGPVCVTGADCFSSCLSTSMAPLAGESFMGGSGALATDDCCTGSSRGAGASEKEEVCFSSGTEVGGVGFGFSAPVSSTGSIIGSPGGSGADGAGSSEMVSSGRGVPPAGVDPLTGVSGTDMTSTGLGRVELWPVPPFILFSPAD